jgi:hypothetical protein
VAAVRRVEGGGDAIVGTTRATLLASLFDFLRYAGGDQYEHSFLDGGSSSVTSIVDRYILLDGC